MSEDIIPYTQPNFHLSPDDYTNIEKLAAVNYSPRQIALFLVVNKKAFLQEYNNLESLVRHHYDKGQLQAKYEIDNAMLENATKGNITAVQIIDKHAEANNIETHKARIFYGS